MKRELKKQQKMRDEANKSEARAAKLEARAEKARKKADAQMKKVQETEQRHLWEVSKGRKRSDTRHPVNPNYRQPRIGR